MNNEIETSWYNREKSPVSINIFICFNILFNLILCYFLIFFFFLFFFFFNYLFLQYIIILLG